jgi:hypothetical protein
LSALLKLHHIEMEKDGYATPFAPERPQAIVAQAPALQRLLSPTPD